VVAACLALALPTAAGASTLSAQLFTLPEGTWSSTHTAYTFKGVGNEQNDLTFRRAQAIYVPPIDIFTDGLNLITNVPASSLAGGIRLLCTPTLLVVACVNGSNETTFRAELGNGNDRGIAYTIGGGTATWDGGPGNDTTGGGEWDDFNIAGPGADRLLGGKGTDFADYSARTTRVEITLDGAANDGGAGEGDNVGVDVERLIAGSGGSRMAGSAATDRYVGGAGDDELIGSPTANPEIFLVDFYGGDGIDTISGGGKRDSIRGEGGNDVLNGGAGDDPINGGAGNDELTGGAGLDFLNGDLGDDLVHVSNDGAADQINCGPGNDVVDYDGAADPADIINGNCEVVT
jgi:Ca2+-binding RTX toxin-like protein